MSDPNIPTIQAACDAVVPGFTNYVNSRSDAKLDWLQNALVVSAELINSPELASGADVQQLRLILTNYAANYRTQTGGADMKYVYYAAGAIALLFALKG